MDMNERIAKVFGWEIKSIDLEEEADLGFMRPYTRYCLKTPTGALDSKLWCTPEQCWRGLPNWSGDLNLMHELVAGLTMDEWYVYHNALWDIADIKPVPWKDTGHNYVCGHRVYEATAAQKSEAWLKVKEVG